VGVGALVDQLRRGVFLDRDGVLNRAVIRGGKPYPPATLEEFKVVESAPECLTALKDLGACLVVITNQPDVARGAQSREVVEQMNQVLRKALPLDDVLVCWHDDKDDCNCRKPSPGLLLQAAETHKLSLPDSFLIGDRWKDIDAGHAAGCRAVLIDYHYNERDPSLAPDARVGSLQEATDWIVRAIQAS